MRGRRILALILILAGVLGLVYRGFSYTRSVHEAKIGSLDLSVRDRGWVSVPTWLGVGAIVIGVLLLVSPETKR